MSLGFGGKIIIMLSKYNFIHVFMDYYHTQILQNLYTIFIDISDF
jgi:hypothetical protein